MQEYLESFRGLVGRRVERLLLVVWPPYCEKRMIDVNISVAFQLCEDDFVTRVSIDSGDNWTPVVSRLPRCGLEFSGGLFGQRIERWMSGAIDDPMEFEIFDVSDEPLFRAIVSQEIAAVQLISVGDCAEPFGVTMQFASDHLILTPISDGSTVETRNFNKLGNLEIFSKLGAIRFCEVE